MIYLYTSLVPFIAAQNKLNSQKIERPFIRHINKPQHEDPSIMTLAGRKWREFFKRFCKVNKKKQKEFENFLRSMEG